MPYPEDISLVFRCTVCGKLRLTSFKSTVTANNLPKSSVSTLVSPALVSTRTLSQNGPGGFHAIPEKAAGSTMGYLYIARN